MLTIQEISLILKVSPNKKALEEAVRHENEIKFYSDPSLDATESNPYYSDFRRRIIAQYNNPKAVATLLNFINYPLKTSEFIDSMFDNLHKMFEGTDAHLSLNVGEEKEKATSLLDLNFWSQEAWERFKTSPNTVIITDAPNEKIDLQNKIEGPYRFFLDISAVMELGQIRNEFQFIIFEQPGKRIHVYTDNSFQVYSFENGDKSNPESWTVIIEESHDLGKCPADWLITTNLNTKNDVVKLSPISKSLGDIYELLLMLTNKNISNTYAAFPLIKTYKNSNCNYDTKIEYCDNGLLKTRDTTNNGSDYNLTDTETGQPKRCPACNKGIGVGEILRVNAPKNKNDVDLIQEPIGYIIPPVAGLKYTDEAIAAKKEDIFNNIVGVTQALNPNQQQNSDRIKANFESRRSVIDKWINVWQKTINSSDEKLLKLSIPNAYKGNFYNMGSRFFLVTLEELYDELDRAKESSDLNKVLELEKNIIDTKYKNNPEQANRSHTINMLASSIRPLGDITNEKLIGLYEKGLINKKDFGLQLKFYDYIERFENQSFPITQFDEGVKPEGIRKVINDKFSLYLAEDGYLTEEEILKLKPKQNE